MKNHRLISLLIAGLALQFSASAIMAVSVNFRSTPGQKNVTSVSMNHLMDSGYIFGLGAFQSNFIPSSANKSQWAANWSPLAYTSYNEKNKFFAGTGTLTSNAAPFSLNKVGYIWGFRASGGNNEWILVSDPTWTWPYATGLGFPVTWDVSLASDVIVGETKGSGFEMKSTDVGGSASAPSISPAVWNTIYPNTGDWSADPDKDGLDTLIEYALGLSPLSANTPANSNPFLSLVENSGTYLSLVVNRPLASFVSLHIEFSSDMVTWTEDGTTVLSNAVQLQVRDSSAMSSATRRFARLRIELQ